MKLSKQGADFIKSRPGYTYDESVGNKRVVRLRESV